jgi:hypothetical protein
VKSMDVFKQHLIGKNVASDIADKLCSSVSESLLGQKCSSLSSIKVYIYYLSCFCTINIFEYNIDIK